MEEFEHVKKVVTFGEIMLRLAPEGYTRLYRLSLMAPLTAEVRTKCSRFLANYGMDASFVTKLPTHEIGQAGINSLRRFGVDTRISQEAVTASASIIWKGGCQPETFQSHL